jgi:hypothetical protein
MDLFCKINYDDLACKIKENKYVEDNKIEKKKYNTVNNVTNKLLIYAIFSKNNIEYENSDNKEIYGDKLKMEIASKIDEDTLEYYDKFKYKKSFSKKLIQTGFMKYNSLSTILYLIDYYKTNIIIYDKNDNKYICMSLKYDKYDLYEYDNHWNYVDLIDPNSITYEMINKDQKYFTYDIKTIQIYNSNLDPISKYKIDDILKLAKDNNIEIKQKDKKLTKKELYDKIYYMNV